MPNASWPRLHENRRGHIVTYLDEVAVSRHRPPYIYFLDPHGRPCYDVPLDKSGTRWATISKNDFIRLRGLGATGVWFLNGNGSGNEYVRTHLILGPSGPRPVLVSRLILGVGKNEVVRYQNGDPLDLRPANLIAYKGKASTNDLELLDVANRYRERQDKKRAARNAASNDNRRGRAAG